LISITIAGGGCKENCCRVSGTVAQFIWRRNKYGRQIVGVDGEGSVSGTSKRIGDDQFVGAGLQQGLWVGREKGASFISPFIGRITSSYGGDHFGFSLAQTIGMSDFRVGGRMYRNCFGIVQVAEACGNGMIAYV
jgi:hypothetical protein